MPRFDLLSYDFPKCNELRIYPISDVHLGASEHMFKEWADFCDRIVNEPNSYVFLAGDLINNATKSSVSNVFDEIMRPKEQKRRIAEMLFPIKDKILCAVSGNHERRSGKDADDDPCYDIFCKLDLEHLYREDIAFVRIHVGGKTSCGGTNPTYIFVVTHGAGGGMLTGGAVNRGERFGYVLDGADALVVGHTHKPFVTQPSKIKIDPQNNCVSIRPFKVVSTTSWLDYGGYAAQKMMNPTSHAPQVILLSGNSKEIKVLM